MRTALAALLEREGDIEVATASWEEAPQRVRRVRPDVCVVDADSPCAQEAAVTPPLLSLAAQCGGRPPRDRTHDARTAAGAVGGGSRARTGVAWCEAPAAEDGDGPALVVLAPPGKPGLLRQATRCKALGYVNKDAPPHHLLRAIRHVAQGRRFVDTTLSFDFLQAAEMPLTPRELNVLSLAAEGASVSEIASSLHLSSGTVRNYMSAITRKTGARNRVDAIRISRGAGWL
ncbi:helix-turn-helix transcriptional regulator [Streptomyces capparidis]